MNVACRMLLVRASTTNTGAGQYAVVYQELNAISSAEPNQLQN